MRAWLWLPLLLVPLLAGCTQKEKDADEIVIRFENTGNTAMLVGLKVTDPDGRVPRATNGTVTVPAGGHSERGILSPLDGKYDVRVEYFGTGGADGTVIETTADSDSCRGRLLITFSFSYTPNRTPGFVAGETTRKCS